MGKQTVITDHSFLIPYITGRVVSDYCESKKISNESLSSQLSLSEDIVERIKNGSYVPDINILGHMARIFKINLAAFIQQCRTVR
ncbi:MAG: hypothetical protein ACOYMZ_00125 [Minisyncoccia bacterium]